jgi:hypothetical protein
MKQGWFKIMFISFCLTGLIQDHTLILPSLNGGRKINYFIFHYKTNCPYAEKVYPWLLDLMENGQHLGLILASATSQFPSPTLRVPEQDYYLNYIGVKAIENAINSMNLSANLHSIYRGYLIKYSQVNYELSNPIKSQAMASGIDRIQPCSHHRWCRKWQDKSVDLSPCVFDPRKACLS